LEVAIPVASVNKKKTLVQGWSIHGLESGSVEEKMDELPESQKIQI
jgi:hypothetical protein